MKAQSLAPELRALWEEPLTEEEFERRLRESLGEEDAIAENVELGFPVPDGCEAWWTGFEVHRGLRPPNLPNCPDAKN